VKIDPSKLLEIRAEILSRNAALAGVKEPSPTASFGGVLTQAVREVASTQADASAATNAFERGETHDVAGMMLARQKSSLAFQATLQVRNKLLSAYKDIMNMPV
jgi:flagellar hook-basal body complex protein FliE